MNIHDYYHIDHIREHCKNRTVNMELAKEILESSYLSDTDFWQDLVSDYPEVDLQDKQALEALYFFSMILPIDKVIMNDIATTCVNTGTGKIVRACKHNPAKYSNESLQDIETYSMAMSKQSGSTLRLFTRNEYSHASVIALIRVVLDNVRIANGITTGTLGQELDSQALVYSKFNRVILRVLTKHGV